MRAARAIETVERVIGWLERTEWGRYVIALIVSLLYSAWATLWTQWSAPLVFLAAVNIFAVGLYLQDRLVHYSRRYLAPPILVIVQQVGVGDRDVTFPIFILNKSSKRSMSLALKFFAVFGGDVLGHKRFASPFIKESPGFTTNLGPQAETSGQLTVPVVGTVYLRNGNHLFTLRVTDMLSGRQAFLRVPGSFPPDYPVNKVEWPKEAEPRQ